jgi:hypothetical protein
MSYTAKSTYKTNAAADFTSGTDQWTGQEVEDNFIDMADSVMWIDQKVTMAALNYDCTLGALQEKTLTGNSTLTISGAVAGMYYTLIKKGAFTLTLPTGEFSASGSATGTGTTVITFMYDGTDYYFNFSSYSAT